MSRWDIGLSEKMKACKEAEPFTDILEGDGGVPEKDPPSSSKTGFKALFENLSKNNSWPDKGNSTPPEDGAG